MSEPYTINVFVPYGDPEGPKIIQLLNWTGVGVAFPRYSWPNIKDREEFSRSGIYILSGPAEGRADDLPKVYVGQGEEIGTRIDAHFANKDFWDWCYAFVTIGNSLNRAHITWLEHKLLALADEAKRCLLDNGNLPKEPGLTEAEKADTGGFLREMLRILPLLTMTVFEKPEPVSKLPSFSVSRSDSTDELRTTRERDTLVAPAQEDGFKQVFLGENRWYAIRIGGGMLDKIKYIAAYRTQPISAITHYAPVERIEPYGDKGKYQVVFAKPAQALPKEIPFADAPTGSMQGTRYTTLEELKSAENVAQLFHFSRS